MATQAPVLPLFNANDKVLCYHGPLLYEAKVLKVEHQSEEDTTTGYVGPNYRVHYKGWKQTWDETVPPSRLLKYTDANLALQATLSAQQQQGNALPKGGKAHSGPKGVVDKSASEKGGAGRKDAGAAGASRGTKRARAEYEDKPTHENMKLHVPDVLKTVLVDDWEAITKNEQLATLPRTPTVAVLLENFKTWAETSPKAPENAKNVLPTIVSGLVLYFDKALGSNLLYRFERPQYMDIKKEYVTGRHLEFGQETEMSKVYGAEHLLRMLVSMPTMIMSSTMERDSVGILRDYINLLLQYLAEHKSELFLSEYVNTPTSYQNISRA